MAYVPEWEQLAEALERVIASGGLSTQEAQCDICRAIADQKIKVRPRVNFIKRTIADHQLQHKFASEYRNYERQLFNRTIPFDMPPRLQPEDLDWDQSCFKHDLVFQPGMKEFPGPPRDARVGIELFSSDVTLLLCSGADRWGAPTQPEIGAAFGGAKSRGIARAIAQCFPEGIPPGLSAKARNRAILEQMQRDGSSIPLNPERAIQRALKALRSR